MDILKDIPDKYFELAIVDPPYGINIANNPFRQMHEKKNWDIEIPKAEYFGELFRISINQFICGGNYFQLPTSQGFIIWDKIQPQDFSSSMCEYIWSSFQNPAKIFKYSVLKEQNKIHPTQKPVALYKWLLKNYAKPNDKIIDTHSGSGTLAVACIDMGFEYLCIEKDKDYFEQSVKHINKELLKIKLF